MSDFKESLLPLLWSYRLTGLDVFEMPENVTWPKATAVYIIVLVLSYGYVLSVKSHLKMESLDILPLVAMVFHYIQICNIITLVTSTILHWIYRKNFDECARRITLIDETLQSFGIDPNYKQEKRENFKVIIIWLVSVTVLYASGFTTYSIICRTYTEVFIQTASFFWPQLVNTLIELIFMIYLSIFKKRFEKINALICNAVRYSSQMGFYLDTDKYHGILMDNQDYDETIASYYEKNRKDLEYLLPTTRQLHLELCSICRLLNRVVGIQIAMQIAGKFGLLIGYSYCFYLMYREDRMPLRIKLAFCIFVVIRIAYGASRLFVTIRTSESISVEAQRTSQMVQEIEDQRQKIVDEIHQYSLQIMHNPLFFTACGFYVLDFEFIQSFAGSVMFYLIILIQNQPSIQKNVLEIIQSDNDDDSATV